MHKTRFAEKFIRGLCSDGFLFSLHTLNSPHDRRYSDHTRCAESLSVKKEKHVNSGLQQQAMPWSKSSTSTFKTNQQICGLGSVLKFKQIFHLSSGLWCWIPNEYGMAPQRPIRSIKSPLSTNPCSSLSPVLINLFVSSVLPHFPVISTLYTPHQNAIRFPPLLCSSRFLHPCAVPFSFSKTWAGGVGEQWEWGINTPWKGFGVGWMLSFFLSVSHLKLKHPPERDEERDGHQ